jgi:DNA-directed RNA polymerase specialized sigma24 family protein
MKECLMSGEPKRTARKPAGTLAASTVVRYAKQVHRYFLRRLSKPQDVEDLAQEVYLRILRLDDRPWMEDPLRYLYTVAANVLTDFRRDERQEEKYLTVD